MQKNIPLMAAIVVVPTVLGMVLFGLWSGSGTITLKAFILNYILGFALAMLVLLVLPTDKIANFFITRFKLDPTKLPFTIWMNASINIAFAFIVGFGSTFLNVFILAKQSMHTVFMGMLKTFLPMFLVSYIISSVCLKQYNKIMAKRASQNPARKTQP